MSPQERRAYIETTRRAQPKTELERKARKARRRRPWSTAEQADLALHESWQRDRAFVATATKPGGFCYLCHQFGEWVGDHPGGHYVAGPIHKPRCTFAPDDGPYPGWAAAGLQRPQQRAPLMEVATTGGPATAPQPENGQLSQQNQSPPLPKEPGR
jgi:hypothetical protein